MRRLADTIVLIHGQWLTPLSWENWAADHYGKRQSKYSR
jgi:hypothetical protein